MTVSSIAFYHKKEKKKHWQILVYQHLFFKKYFTYMGLRYLSGKIHVRVIVWPQSINNKKLTDWNAIMKVPVLHYKMFFFFF